MCGVRCACEWGHSCLRLPPPVCLTSLFHKTASSGEEKGVSVVLGEGGNDEKGEREKEQERKGVVPTPTRGLWQWRESIRLPSRHCRQKAEVVKKSRRNWILKVDIKKEKVRKCYPAGQWRQRKEWKLVLKCSHSSSWVCVCVSVLELDRQTNTAHTHTFRLQFMPNYLKGRNTSLFLILAPMSEYRTESGVRGEGQQEKRLLVNMLTVADAWLPHLCRQIRKKDNI